MSDSILNRPRRQIEPRLTDERGQDFADQSPAPGQGAIERRDPGADALSELARLIGQTDPVAPLPARPAEVHKPGGRLADVSRGALSATAADHDPFIRPAARELTQSQDRLPLDRGARREPDFGRSRAPVQPTHSDADDSEAPHASDSFDFLQLPDRDHYAVAPRHALADEADYDDSDHRGRHPAYGRQHEEYADEYHDSEYEQDGDLEYAAEQGDADEGGSGVKRRSTTKVAIAVLGLAVFGSAAAFGYRTIFKTAPSGPAPIIRADNSPTKVTPTGTEANARPANGLFGDRSGEQLVRRDEEPIDVGATYRSGAIGSGTAASSPSEIFPPVQSGDPKRVRTVPIRVDQSAAPSDRTASRAAPPPQSQPPLPAPPRQAVVPPPQSQPAVQFPQRQAAVAPPSPYPSSPSGEGRVAAGVAPMAVVPEAAASRSIEAGGFVVQVSAQRSEVEAQTAFRTLQGKYSVLNGRDPLIRRKDLGERGIFFAAQVGPFGVKSEADQLCETLKSAGGACFVQKN